MRRVQRSAQAGFTLIELMIGLVISSLLIAMVMSIVIRMSSAYRSQQQIAELQTILSASTTQLRQDAKLAGYGLPNGFTYGSPASPLAYNAPIQFTNGSSGAPDTIKFFWADPSKRGRINSHGFPAGSSIITIDALDAGTAAFAAEDIVVITNVSTEYPTFPDVTTGPKVAAYKACLAQIQSVNANILTLKVSGVFGSSNQAQCADVRAIHTTEAAAADTMIYLLGARGYRINASNLETSSTGGLLSDWTIVGVGFRDLQVAMRTWDGWSGGTAYTWWSANSFGASTAIWPVSPALPNRFGPFAQPTEAVITFVVETLRTIAGVGSTVTPNLNGAQLGDHAALTGLAGNHIIRYSSVRVDFRNMAVSE